MDDFIGEKASTNSQVLIDSHIQLPKRSVGMKGREALQNKADGLRNCEENLSAMNLLGEVTLQSVMLRIVQTLSMFLRNKWIHEV